ncbi:MAG: ABC transporter permease [Deltaproteobacteria bacterium]|nr:ABC transporter permease [Deltaproteobacteria bacterium]
MRRYLLGRLLRTVPVVFGVVTVVFLLIHLLPGDPVEIMLGESAVPAQKEELRRELRLDRPILSQYASFLAGIPRGDLGVSFRSREPVLGEIARRIPATVLLAATSITVAVLVALPLGVFAAMRRGKAADYLSGFAAMLSLSIPNFLLGPLLVLLFSVQLGLLPVSGYGAGRPLVLPAITLGTGMAALLTRMVRATLLEELRKEYVTAAMARGLSYRSAVALHALRNALVPVVTALGLSFGAVLAGSVITETIFSWPGIGRLLIQAIDARDYPLVQGCVLVIALSTVAVNLATDILCARLDPRIRYE